MADKKIVVELSPTEAEILCGAIANHIPSDKSHEMILAMLYNRIESKIQEFLRK